MNIDSIYGTVDVDLSKITLNDVCDIIKNYSTDNVTAISPNVPTYIISKANKR